VNADYEYMKFFLMMHTKTEVLENFYHNQLLLTYQKDSERYIERLKLRDACDKQIGFGSGQVAEWDYEKPNKYRGIGLILNFLFLL
jgi:hypothetical protein